MGLSDIVKKVYERQIRDEAERKAQELDKDYLENKDKPTSEENKDLENRINVIDINLNDKDE